MSAMSDTLKVFIPGKPEPLRRHRTAVRGRRAIQYDPPENKANKALIQSYASIAMARQGVRGPYQCPLRVEFFFCFERPKSARRRLFPSVKPDVDNLQKLVMDALNGVVWQDDALIVQAEAYELYDAPTGTVLFVSELEADGAERIHNLLIQRIGGRSEWT